MVSGKNNFKISCLILTALFFFCAQSRAGESFRTVYKVRNLSCGACVGKIDTKLKDYDGYMSMLANIDLGLVVVDHRDNLTGGQIAEAITSLGYPAEEATRSESDQCKSVSGKSSGWKSPEDGSFAWIKGLFNR